MTYDLVVVGGGSGGVRAARIAAGLGAKVAIIEDTFWGGTCVNVGCVPKKLYHYAASIKNHASLGVAYGWDIQLGSIDWQQFHANKSTEIARLNGIYSRMLGNAGCEVFDGHGKLLDANTVQVTDAQGNTSKLTAKKILLAVGGKPRLPEIEGISHAIDSDALFALAEIPKRLLVVGGGYIACEMASIYHKLGSEVTLLVRSKLLRSFDREAVDFLENELVNDGLNIQKGVSPQRLQKTDAGIQVSFDDDTTADDDQSCYDQVLFATGREPRFHGLGLENTQVQLSSKGFIKVNDNFQTDEPSVYAVGDIIEGLELTPVALEQGMYLAKMLFDSKPPIKPAFDSVATAIFTHPQLASVGMTEEQATEHAQHTGETVAVFTSSFRHIKYTVTQLQKRTFIKLLVNQSTDAILGIHMVGDEVGEIMQGFGVLLHTGISKTQLDQTIGIHPTVAEELVTMREPSRVITKTGV